MLVGTSLRLMANDSVIQLEEVIGMEYLSALFALWLNDQVKCLPSLGLCLRVT